MKTTEQKVPALRFPEFEGEWEEKKLGEVSKRITTKNIERKITTVFSNSAINGIVKQEELFDFSVGSEINNDRYYIVEEDDFVYNPRISINAPVGPMKRNNLCEKGIISPLYTVLRIEEGCFDYFEKYFDSNTWHPYMRRVANYGVRFDRMNITNEDLLNLLISFPSLPEQQKIADFLSATDKRLELLKEKKLGLEDYKRGAMQRIFSQELRFTRTDGSAYEDWEEKKLGEISKSLKSGGTPTSTNKEYYDGNIPFLSISDMTAQGKYLRSTNKKVSKEGVDNSSSWIVPIDSLIYSMYASVGFVSIAKIELAISQAVICVQLKEDYSLEYIYYFLLDFRKNIYRYIETGTQGNINAQIVKNICINLPCLDEQHQIADFLSAIDDKILLLNQQIQSTEQYKKGLLQQMFV